MNKVKIENGRVWWVDAQTGAKKSTFGDLNPVVSADCDGEIACIVYQRGEARRFDAKSYADKGMVGVFGAVECSIKDGHIFLKYKNGNKRKYDSRTGADKGGA